MYKTDITPTRWIVYDIFGNVGWIAYYVVLVKCFAEKPEFMQYWGLAAVAVLAITAALALYAALWRRVSGDALPWYLLTAALSVAYILLTILPPAGGIFTPCTVATGGTIPF